MLARELAVLPVGLDRDVEVLAEQRDAGLADVLGDEDAGHAAAPRWRVDDPVDAGRQRLDVGRLDRREHRDAQLVAPELAVGLDVDDAVGAQRRGDLRGVDRVVEVDRADDERALRRLGDERRREVAGLAPSRRGASDEAVVRSTHQSRPPPSFIQSSCSASSTSVAIAGVL